MYPQSNIDSKSEVVDQYLIARLALHKRPAQCSSRQLATLLGVSVRQAKRHWGSSTVVRKRIPGGYGTVRENAVTGAAWTERRPCTFDVPALCSTTTQKLTDEHYLAKTALKYKINADVLSAVWRRLARNIGPQIMTAAEIAKEAGVSRDTAYRHLKRVEAAKLFRFRAIPGEGFWASLVTLPRSRSCSPPTAKVSHTTSLFLSSSIDRVVSSKANSSATQTRQARVKVATGGGTQALSRPGQDQPSRRRGKKISPAQIAIPWKGLRWDCLTALQRKFLESQFVEENGFCLWFRDTKRSRKLLQWSRGWAHQRVGKLVKRNRVRVIQGSSPVTKNRWGVWLPWNYQLAIYEHKAKLGRKRRAKRRRYSLRRLTRREMVLEIAVRSKQLRSTRLPPDDYVVAIDALEAMQDALNVLLGVTRSTVGEKPIFAYHDARVAFDRLLERVARAQRRRRREKEVSEREKEQREKEQQESERRLEAEARARANAQWRHPFSGERHPTVARHRRIGVLDDPQEYARSWHLHLREGGLI